MRLPRSIEVLDSVLKFQCISQSIAFLLLCLIHSELSRLAAGTTVEQILSSKSTESMPSGRKCYRNVVESDPERHFGKSIYEINILPLVHRGAHILH